MTKEDYALMWNDDYPADPQVSLIMRRDKRLTVPLLLAIPYFQ